MSHLQEETYKSIKSKYPHLHIKENYRPQWLLSSNLTRLEIDLYIESLSIGIEVQGLQHYEFVPHFHKTYDNFLAQLRRDEEKKDLCYGRKIKLIEIACFADLHSFMFDLEKIMSSESEAKYFYQKPAKKSKMSSEGYRKHKNYLRMKEKRRLYRLAHPANSPKEKPGNQRMRHRARVLLSINELSISEWLVYGGESEHTVKMVDDNLVCDCRGKSGICSHILKVTQKEWDDFSEAL